jgi:hypothetical protein
VSQVVKDGEGWFSIGADGKPVRCDPPDIPVTKYTAEFVRHLQVQIACLEAAVRGLCGDCERSFDIISAASRAGKETGA